MGATHFDCGSVYVRYAEPKGWYADVKYNINFPANTKPIVVATPVHNAHVANLGNCGGFVEQWDDERKNKSFGVAFYIDGVPKTEAILVNWIACI
ncbi:hypothetical protein PT974_01786 [Cladobotryum mycophilum]|uniref:Uncharacterized protein n=1 Tax=Cladobotryum mycophilum TaxID=491253 RepID=A0ABR0SX30_9HYPO